MLKQMVKFILVWHSQNFEELTHLAGAFKTQAELELSESRWGTAHGTAGAWPMLWKKPAAARWFRLVTQLRRRGDDDTVEKLKATDRVWRMWKKTSKSSKGPILEALWSLIHWYDVPRFSDRIVPSGKTFKPTILTTLWWGELDLRLP